ncbi:hypothetical protein AB0K02_11045 [Streptomyces sp. NPDC049597]|uniref:hypothetical protein n=1 Tax=Streptomyces sp. NPDC049597 TaxID=3155276 RepID=UPI00343FB8EA
MIGALLASAPQAARLNQIGSLLQFVPERDATGLHGTGGHWPQILGGMFANGVMFMPSGKIFLSTAHRQADIDATADALDKVLHQLQAAAQG